MAVAKKKAAKAARKTKTVKIVKDTPETEDIGLAEDRKADAAAPLRRCIVTKQSLPKTELIRFVMAPNGRIVPDIRNKLPGRGVWVKAELAHIQQAVKRSLFARAFDQAAIVPPDLASSVVAQLQLWIADLLGLAKKAGEALAGFDKAEAALRQGKVGLLIEARDGAKNGREKLHRYLKGGVEALSPLDSSSLGRALGRDQAVHVVIMRGRLADKLAGACRKLMAMEG